MAEDKARDILGKRVRVAVSDGRLVEGELQVMLKHKLKSDSTLLIEY